MKALQLALRSLAAPDADAAPPVRRSRRDWIVDGVVFVFAAGLGAIRR